MLRLMLSSVRNFIREPLYSSINVIGLTIGLSCCLFSFIWVQDELNFDNQHVNRDRIFALLQHARYPEGGTTTYSSSPAPMALALQDELPEIDAAIRTSWPERKLFTTPEKSMLQEGIFADPSLFRTFTFAFVQGSPERPLPDNHSIAVSRQMSIELFGTVDVMGRTVLYGGNTPLSVTAVYEDLPRLSTMFFDFVIPYELAVLDDKEAMDWGNFDCYIYLMLKDGKDKHAVEDKIKGMMKGSLPSLPELASKDNGNLEFFLHPMSDWRLRNSFEGGIQTGGRIVYVYSFAIAAFIVLLLACINFMNLSTARAVRRSKEIGVRKVVGASRTSLIRQFLSESLATTIMALVLSLLIVQLSLPVFNSITGKSIFIDYGDPVLIGSLAVVTILTAVMAGGYPALYLSSFSPASVIRGNLFTSQKGIGLRKGLVIVQFSASVALMTCAIVVNRQMAYIQNKELGYDRSNILYFTPRSGLSKNYSTLRTELLRDPSIVAVAQGDTHPMNVFNNDYAVWEGIFEENPVTVQSSVCDYDYITAMGFALKSGRLFNRELASDSNAMIINETLAEIMGNDPIGKKLKVYTITGHVIGVIKDFNNNSLQHPIDPVVFLLNPGADEDPMTVFVRYQSGKQAEAVSHLQSVYKKMENAFPLEFQFMDATFDRNYENDNLMGQLAVFFTAVAISISCLGLFGLSLFTTERRTKEIGIRKVLGASVHQIVMLICHDFFGPVLLAMGIGIVPAYFTAEEFLQRYTFHTPLSIWIFAAAVGTLAVISLLTILYQSIHASIRSPVEALRMN